MANKMAWNPSPEVAIARDFGTKFNYDKVYIIGLNERKAGFGVISYGKTKEKCKEASKAADRIYEQIINGTIIIE